MILSSDNKAIENKTYNLLVETKEAVEKIKQSSSSNGGYEILNSSILYPSQRPLDEILGAKIVCRGYVGTSFTITNAENFFEPFTLTIDENTEIVPNYTTQRQFVLSVQLGNYHVKATDGTHTTEWDFIVDTIGKSYFTEYMWELARFTANGTYTCNIDTYDYLYVSAIAGGGGGGGGRLASWTPTRSTELGEGGGGGGGGAGKYIIQSKFKCSDYPSLALTIGTGGAGGGRTTAGSAGTATIIGSLITLAGGTGGKIGVATGTRTADGDANDPATGGAGGTGGASGGKGGDGGASGAGLSADDNYCKATQGAKGGTLSSLSGTPGAGGAILNKANYWCHSGGGGGGGAAGLFTGSNGGKGGNAGAYGSYAGTGSGTTSQTGTVGTAGTGYGSGGGGGGGGYSDTYPPTAGGKGAPGIVVFYSGVIANG